MAVECYQESIQIYNSIDKKELSNWQLVALYEGLGDVYLLTKSYQASINAFTEGLKVAQKHLILPKVTDLNSKIAQVYNAKGENLATCEILGAWINLKTRSLTTLPEHLLSEMDTFPKSKDFKIITKEDTRKFGKKPIHLS